MKKKFLVTVTALIISLSSFSYSAMAQVYSDINEGDWAYESVNKASTYGFMGGMGDGTFGTGTTLKRAEFASMLTRMMKWQPVDTSTPSFKDNTDTSKWYYSSVETLLENKAIALENGNFRPNEDITREEIAVMLIKALGYSALAESVENTGVPFNDVFENKGYITVAYDFGIISGKDASTFSPKGTALREEAAAMMVRAYEKINSKLEWKHGFYAISAWSQKDIAKDMDAVSFGWSKMEYRDNEVVLNTTVSNSNEWNIPVGYEEIVKLLESNNVQMNLNVFMSNSDAGSPCETILTDPALRAEAVTQIINELTVDYKATGYNFYDGVTIDFENLRGTKMKSGFTEFLNQLKVELNKIDKQLYVAVQPLLKNGGQSFDGYDFEQINKVADKVILMAHDYAPSKIDESVMSMGFTTTPVTPFEEVYYALKKTAEKVDKNKLVLAISINSAGWNVADNAVTNSRAITLLPSEILAKLEAGNVIKAYSDKYRNPYIKFQSETGETTLWYEDARSVDDKIELGKMLGINSVSVWRVGTIPNYSGNDLNVWETIKNN